MADKKKPTGDYEVGYCRPPPKNQIRKGERKNPTGRPKGTKNLKTDLLEELGEQMKIRENGKERRVSKQRALIKSLVARALKGNDRAAAKVLDLYLRVTGIDDDAKEAGLPLTDNERAVMQALEERLRRRAGLAAPKSDDKSPDDDDGANRPDNDCDDGETS